MRYRVLSETPESVEIEWFPEPWERVGMWWDRLVSAITGQPYIAPARRVVYKPGPVTEAER